MEANIDFVGAGAFEGLVEFDDVAVNGNAGFLEFFVDIHVGNGSKGFATLSSFEGEDGLEFLNFAGDFFGFSKVFGFTFDAGSLEFFEVFLFSSVAS